MTPPVPKVKSLWSRAAVVALTCALVLVAAEVFFAVFRPVPHSVDRNVYYQADPWTGYRPRPNSLGFYGDRIEARINSLGFRDEPVSRARPSDVFRILALGDSFTLGADVRQEESYPEVLEDRLNERFDTRFEVINAGVGGWSPFQYAQFYEHYGRELEPQFVLIGFFVGNDAYVPDRTVESLPTAVLGRRISKKASLSMWTELKVILCETTNLGRLAFAKAPRSGHPRREHCEDFSASLLEIQTQRLANHIEPDYRRKEAMRRNIDHILRIKKMTDEAGIPLLVVLIPDENQTNAALRKLILSGDDPSRYDFALPQSKLRKILGRKRVEVLDLLSHVRADPRCLYMNDTHLSTEGLEVVAAGIEEALIPLLPSAVKR